MKIKHQKKLIELSENIKSNNSQYDDMLFIDLLKKVCLDLIDVSEDELYYVDFEYLIFLIRGKSYGEEIEYIKTSNGTSYNMIFSIDKDFKIEGEKGLSSQEITLSNKEVVEISPIFLNEMENLQKINNNDLLNYSTITYSLRKVKNDNEVKTFSDYEEKANYINELELSDLKKLKEAYNKFPKINGKKIEYINNIKVETNFLDIMSNFFVIV
jgi:hypothetical protein